MVQGSCTTGRGTTIRVCSDSSPRIRLALEVETSMCMPMSRIIQIDLSIPWGGRRKIGCVTPRKIRYAFYRLSNVTFLLGSCPIFPQSDLPNLTSKSPSWLTVDWVLSQFGQERQHAASHYRRFVREGINRPSIWEGVQAQVLLGKEDFVEKLRGYVQGYEAIAEIPRSQRYVSRPQLTKLFEGKRTKAMLVLRACRSPRLPQSLSAQ